MSKGFRLKFVFIGLVFGFLIFCSTSFLRSEELSKGSILGFVYEEDGTTPLEGAVVEFKNITTGAVYESSKSDDLGVFKIEGVERGLYIYGVKTAQGDFNSDGPIGVRIRENETAKLSISLTPYEEKVRSAIEEIYREQETEGKSVVGRAVNYNPDTRIAEVMIMKGLLQVDDKIYAKGDVTDFYQDVNFLGSEDSFVEGIFAGQSASLAVKNKVEIGDLIYKVAKSGVLPLFSKPSGVASVVTGSSEIVGGVTVLCDGWQVPSSWREWWRNWWANFLKWLCTRWPNHPWCGNN
jgi:hypothetical protein